MKVLEVVLTLAVIIGALRIFYFLRARAMRSLATQLNFHYLGPETPPEWLPNPFKRKKHIPIPRWIYDIRLFGQATQIWNVIEGTRNGAPIVVCDVVVGDGRGSHPCTLIACQTDVDPFVRPGSAERLVESHGRFVIHGAWLLWFSWTMRVARIEKRLTEM